MDMILIDYCEKHLKNQILKMAPLFSNALKSMCQENRSLLQEY